MWERNREKLSPPVPLPFQQNYPGPTCFTNQNGLRKNIGGRVRNIRSRTNDLPRLKLEFARGASDVRHTSMCFDVVSCVDRGKEFNRVVGTKEPFIAVKS